MSDTTKVISARVPVDVAEMVENACVNNGLSKSAYITNLVTNPTPNVDATAIYSKGVRHGMRKGGNVSRLAPNPAESEIPTEIKHIMSAVGGAGAGYLVYNILDEHLPNDYFSSEEQKKNIMLLASTAVALGAIWGISKLLKSV